MKKKIIFFVFIVMHVQFFDAYANEEWRADFDNLCGKTEEAMTFKPEELKDLVARCDKLKPLIEKCDQPQKKIFLKRLEMCRNLYSYVLEMKERKGQ